MYRPRNGTVAASSTTSTSAWTSCCQLIRTAPDGSAPRTGTRCRGQRSRGRSSCRCPPRRSCRHSNRCHCGVGILVRPHGVDGHNRVIGTDDPVAPTDVHDAQREERTDDGDENDVSHGENSLSASRQPFYDRLVSDSTIFPPSSRLPAQHSRLLHASDPAETPPLPTESAFCAPSSLADRAARVHSARARANYR